MSEQKLVDMGAECVCGDLLLDRETVGKYRNGSFMLTEAGLAVLSRTVDVEAAVPVSKPARKARAAAPEVADKLPVDPDADAQPE